MTVTTNLRKYKPIGIIIGAVCIGIILYFNVYTSSLLRKVRNEIVYRSPISIPGMPACPDCNVVLINLDTLRPANMGCYGYSRDTMPNVCAFAKRNMIFTQFFTQSSFTLDSHMSIFTGLYPSTHHVIDALKDTLSPDIPIMTQVLQKHGYRTIWAGITDDINLPLVNGFERGFSEIHDLNGTHSDWNEKYRKLLPALEGDTPAFIFFHSYAPHSPYFPGTGQWRFSERKYPWIPVTEDQYYAHGFDFYAYMLASYKRRLKESVTAESIERNSRIVQQLSVALANKSIEQADQVAWSLPGYEQYDLNIGWYWKNIDPSNPAIVNYMKDLYDEKLSQIDRDIKELLDFLNRPEIKRKTIVILLSDNGEDFAEHGFFDHGWNIYNTGTHAPFVVAAPRMKNGTYHELVQAIDIFPTILDLVGIQRDDIPLEGNSLFSIMNGRGESQVGERHLISQHRGDNIVSIRNTRWKMYKNDYEDHTFVELYDLLRDPGEQSNVLGKHLDMARHLDMVLTRTLEASPKYATTSGTFPDWLDDEKRRSLINEGYF